MIPFLWSYLCGDLQVSAHLPHPLASAPSQAPLASAPERKKKSKQPPTGCDREEGLGMGRAGAGRMLGRLPLWAWGAMSLCGHISRPHQLTPAAGSPSVTVPSSTSPLSTQPPTTQQLGNPSPSLLSQLSMGVGFEVWCQVTSRHPSPRECQDLTGPLLEQRLLEAGTISPTTSLPQGTQ